MSKTDIQELEREVEKDLNNLGIVIDAKIHRGDLRDLENLPSIKYRVRVGKEKQVKALRESILNILHQNTSEDFRIQDHYDEREDTYIDELVLNPNIRFNQRQDMSFRYHVLYTMRKEISNFSKTRGKQR
jgi:hypothetical protein